jgi:hypothetical protein
MHAQRTRPYEIAGVAWTLCLRTVGLDQIAAFEDGVTCRSCQKAIAFNRESEEERQRGLTK